MFEAEEVIFAPTNLCNLKCAHCNVESSTKKLSTKYAIRFLKSCADNGIEWVGFSGGEPFLCTKFLNKVSQAVVDNEMYFDRLMTNAVWFKNKSQLVEVLEELYESGFDGTFGVSVDSFHKQDLKKVAMFIRTVMSIWDKDDCVEIISVIGVNDKETDQKLVTLAGFLGLKKKDLPVNKIELSPVTDDFIPDAWNDSEWFKDDYCKGPGNVFYVHPDGRVAVCCGYANQQERLIIGNIRNDSLEKLKERVRDSEFISTVYTKGLSSIRKDLESRGYKFPGKTKNHCFFCNYILENGLL